MSNHILIKGQTAVDDAEYEVSTWIGHKGTTYTMSMINKMRNYWTTPNKQVLEVLDDGDGFVFKIGKKSIPLDYSQIQEVLAMIKFINAHTAQKHEVYEVEYQEQKL